MTEGVTDEALIIYHALSCTLIVGTGNHAFLFWVTVNTEKKDRILPDIASTEKWNIDIYYYNNY